MPLQYSYDLDQPPSYFKLATRLIGTREIGGPQHNPLVLAMHQVTASHSAGYGSYVPTSDETAWCASFVGFCLYLSGYQLPPLALRARSWLQYGLPVEYPNARRGDLVVLARSGSPVDATVLDAPGHIGFFDSRLARPASGYLKLLGGNQHNSVSYEEYSDSLLLGIRRP